MENINLQSNFFPKCCTKFELSCTPPVPIQNPLVRRLHSKLNQSQSQTLQSHKRRALCNVDFLLLIVVKSKRFSWTKSSSISRATRQTCYTQFLVHESTQTNVCTRKQQPIWFASAKKNHSSINLFEKTKLFSHHLALNDKEINGENKLSKLAWPKSRCKKMSRKKTQQTSQWKCGVCDDRYPGDHETWDLNPYWEPLVSLFSINGGRAREEKKRPCSALLLCWFACAERFVAANWCSSHFTTRW